MDWVGEVGSDDGGRGKKERKESMNYNSYNTVMSMDFLKAFLIFNKINASFKTDHHSHYFTQNRLS